MILISLVLVLISAVCLLIGGFFREDLVLLYVSIGTALAAGLFLALGVLRGARRPKRPRAAKPVGSTQEAPAATWKGGAAPETGPLLTRDEPDQPSVTSDAEPSAASQAPSRPEGGVAEEEQEDQTPQPAAQDPTPTPTPPPPAAPPQSTQTPPSRPGTWAPPPPPTPPPGAPGGPPLPPSS